MIGTSLNQYRITASIGAGGMGEVFRARDTRLNRDVAVKVLPKDFVADADRLRRFEQEAKTLAALNHPNVLTIHDAGVHDGAPYLVSELLEGKTLRDEMNGNALPMRKATEFALQMANGLAAAHGKGIIHRDLKPENIFITKDGRVKILDFGLAKLRTNPQSAIRNPQSTEGATIRIDTDAIINTTEPGMVLGTPAYMSPEQVRGEPADHRADIFAFGAVLYEMLSGTCAFRRNTPVESMNAVLNDTPPALSTTHPNIPLALARIVERCLEKQPDNRFQSARDLAFAIESGIAPGQTPSPHQFSSKPGLRHSRMLAAAVAVIAVTVAFIVGRWERHTGEPHNWRGQRLGGPSIALRPVVSPDGKEIAFSPLDQGMTQLGVMNVDSGDWRQITTNRALGNVGYFCWSREGTELFFDRIIAQPLGIFRVSKYGGEERLILENAQAPQLLSDDSLLVSLRGKGRFQRIHRYWIGGQRLEPLNAIMPTLDFGFPYKVLPGGREVLFFGSPADASRPGEATWILNLESDRCELLAPNPPKLVIEWASSPHAPDSTGNSLITVDIVGDAYRIVRRPRHQYSIPATLFSLTLPPANLDVSRDGSLYLDQVERPVEILRCVNSNRVQRIPLSASYEMPQVLPLPGGRLLLPSRIAGKHRLVVLAPGQEATPFLVSKEESREPFALLGRDRVLCLVGSGSNWVVTIVSLADGRMLGQLKFIPADSSLKALASAPNGKTVYYVAFGSIWSVPVEGGSPNKIRDGDGVAPDPAGKFLLVQVNQTDGTRLIRVSLSGGPEEILATPYPVVGAPLHSNAIGPDGRIVMGVAPRDSWYWSAAILDPKTGAMEMVSDIDADMNAPGWDEQGRVVVPAMFLRASLWRFRPER